VIEVLRHPSPVGLLTLVATGDGLAAVSFGEAATPIGRGDGDGRGDGRPIVGQAAVEIDEYFAGTRRAFTVPLDWRLTTGFRRAVLQELARVPFGAVVTYGELAHRVGRPGGARAVGRAMATNPLPLVVPCHRVLAAGGRIGGYSGGTGLDTKRMLLALEGVLLAP
jgi:methylated-DNA-[protein]-cysteine S-methyltransferase